MGEKDGTITVVYIMGAGRSGTTILSALLGSSPYVFSGADLMQVYEYIRDNKICGDGNKILESKFWAPIIEKFVVNDTANIDGIISRNGMLEFHSAFFKNIFGIYDHNDLVKYENELFELYTLVAKASGKRIIIDSSKYPNRALLSRRLKGKIDIKYIYNIRDVRGVINSFSKKVQTPKTPMSAIIYYNAINIMSEVVYRLLPKKDRIRVRYEDLISDDFITMRNLSSFIGVPFSDLESKVRNEDALDIGPVIEGNRLVKKRKLKFSYDEEWRKNITRWRQILYYIFALPILALNRYRI